MDELRLFESIKNGKSPVGAFPILKSICSLKQIIKSSDKQIQKLEFLPLVSL